MAKRIQLVNEKMLTEAASGVPWKPPRSHPEAPGMPNIAGYFKATSAGLLPRWATPSCTLACVHILKLFNLIKKLLTSVYARLLINSVEIGIHGAD